VEFRKQPKRRLEAMVPEDIERIIRENSGGIGRRSLAEVTSEILCLGLDIDPRRFGIEPQLADRRKPGRRKAAV
jgi:hypothetical protein